jgi:hypothetical protein
LQISSIESSIKASQNTVQTKKGWQLNVAQTNLQNSQNSLNTVLEKKETALLSISKSIELQKGTTDTNGLFIAKLAAVVFLLFETLNLLCYWFIYQYYSNVVLENTVFKEITKSITNAVHDATHTVTSAFTNIAPTNAVTSTVFPPTIVTNSHRNTIGFQTNNSNSNSQITAAVSQITPQTQTVLTGNGNKICLNSDCQKAYIYKVHNQKFCSEKCRIQSWNKKSDKPFIKGKKK